MPEEKSLYRMKMMFPSVLSSDGPIDCILGAFRVDRLADPVLSPSSTTIYGASNTQRVVSSVTSKIIIDYYPPPFSGGTRDELFCSRMDWRLGSLYRMDDLKQTHCHTKTLR